VAWREGGRVRWQKNLSTGELITLLKKLEGEVVIHFRWASVGGVDARLCHPFPVTPKSSVSLSGMAETVLFHNGTWSGYVDALMRLEQHRKEPLPSSPMSDTRAAALVVHTTGPEALNKLPGRWVWMNANETRLFGPWEGLLAVLKDSGHPGLVLVLDEVETLQRVRADSREKALNALRQLIDELDAGRFPGLYLVITGTPSFFDGPQGLKKLPPLAQRLQTDFDTDIRFDNPRAPQIRLKPFDMDMMIEVGGKVRDLFADGSSSPDRVKSVADDELILSLARGVTGSLGGKTGIAPRIFLKKLVADLLDRIELHEAFNPRKDYRLTIRNDELTMEERNAMPASSIEDISLDL
jgi:hypothetical protein